jgi:hypothetical protein
MIKAKNAIWWLEFSPYDLDRYKPEIISDAMALFLIACVFYVNGLFYDGSMFDPNVWGTFATQFPAQMWATISLVGCSAMIIGLLKPPIGWMVSVGAFIMLINFALLGYSAAFTGHGFIGFFIGLYSTIYFARKFLRILAMGVASYGAK